MSDSSADRDPLERLAEEFIARLRAGERPSLTEYAERYPELADQIIELFPALVEMEQLKPVTADHSEAFVSSVKPSDPERVGEFRILRRIGRGGMGVVYEAVQESLGRHVALKLLPPDSLADPNRLERFRREAKSAARLHHTNIVPVYGTGEAHGRHYYAMQFIDGHPLDAVIHEVRRVKAKSADGPAPRAITEVAAALMTGTFTRLSPSVAGAATVTYIHHTLPPATPLAVGESSPALSSSLSDGGCTYWATVSRLGAQVADALAYAHAQGVLHRDIKPANLLLDLQGTVWVTDFGLAKTTDSDDLTHVGDIVGTIRYMAPERFDGAGDQRADVYALGLTLYELLTLKPAYFAENRAKLVEQVVAASPPKPRAIDPTIPRDLETIVLKAIQRDPALRYQSATELADDLRRYGEDRPIWARRASTIEQAWRWCRRNPAVASLIGSVFGLMAVLAIVMSVGSYRLSGALTKASDNLNRATIAERDARLREAEALIGEAHGIRYSKREGQRFAAIAALKKAAEIGRELGQPKEWFDRLRNEAIAALALPDLHVTKQWPGWPEGTVRAAVSGDFQVYARSDRTGAISVRRLADDSELARIPGTGAGCEITLNRDGTHLVQSALAGDLNYTARLWKLDAEGPRELFAVPQVHAIPRFMVFPEGLRLVSINVSGAISVHDVATGQRTGFFEAKTVTEGARIVAHPHDPLVAVSSYLNQTVVVRDIRTGAVVSQEKPPWRNGCGAAWHPSGDYLCITNGDTSDARVYQFEAATGKLTYLRTIPECGGGDPTLQFNPRGDRFFVTGWVPLVQMWDFWTGHRMFALTKSSMAGGWANTSPVLSPDTTQLALATLAEGDSQIGLWSVADARECRPIVPSTVSPPGSGYFALHPNGRIVAQAYANGLRLFDLPTGAELGLIQDIGPPQQPSCSICFDGLGNLYTNSFRGAFRWPVQADPTRPNRWNVGPPTRLPFNPGFQWIATNRDGTVVAQAMTANYGMAEYAGGWILHPKSPLPRWVEAGTDMGSAVVTPDGRLVAFSPNGGNISVFEAGTGKKIWQGPEGFGARAFSRDGRFLLAAGVRGRIFSVGDWESGPDLGPGNLMDATSDNALAVLSGAGFYRLVETATGRELARLEDPDNSALMAVFSPDGMKLIAQAKNGLRVWDLRRIRQELDKLGLDWDAPPYPPAPPEPKIAEPIQVEVIGADLISDPKKIAQYELDSLLLKLWQQPFDGTASAQLGETLMRLGRSDRAYDAFSRALAFGASPQSVLYPRALAAFRLKRWLAAIDDASQVLATDAENSRVRFLRAQACRMLKRNEDAIADYTEVLKQFPKDGGVYAYRADCHEALGQFDKAAADRDRAVELEPDNPILLNNLAWRLVVRPDDKLAAQRGLRLIQKAAQKEQDSAVYLNTLGVAQYRNGLLKEAIATLVQSLAAAKGESDAFDLYFLAMCHAKLNDPVKAKDFFDRAVAWVDKKKDLNVQYQVELTAFRAEAEQVLRSK